MTATGSVTLVPSVHFSPVHRRRVRTAIRDAEPDLVAVELDERRYERMERNARLGFDDLASLPPATACVYAILRTIQRTVVRLYGFDPETTDMEAAVETASELGIDVALIDDPIAETISALVSRVGPATVPRTLLRAQRLDPARQAEQLELLAQPFEEIERGDDVQPAIDQLRHLFPEVAEVMIDRRDRAMARRLHALRRDGYDVVAVVGAGHHNGVRDELARLEDAGNGVDLDDPVPIRTPTRSVTRIPIE
ncbi:TraB domain-containing protein [Natrarchaeobius oligotrophus]|uniref:Conjugal transfer protein TraB n=1 Tax=Natrarchaeobius chitinivorans TaxID=1679083 RepID=A0A3N6M9B3_NATCH|nr:TraB domain-containing protein [Natrarchaeobius chitinivorans]RQG98997.1 conjugal transfer protein TraB [Natrarchaeobius chitinivorans]